MLKTVLFQSKNAEKLLRFLSVAQPREECNRIKAWQVHSYGEDLQCCLTRIPIISKPSEMLVKIEAASINPLDVLMKDGYGRSMLKLFTCQEMVLPLTLGRDFSGTIVDIGHAVGSEYKIGDKVYGVIPFYNAGSHAECAIVDASHVLHKPSDLSATEAAAVPYAALTAYSALWLFGGLCYKRTQGVRVLVLGASGGVGTYAIQMLKAVGADVIGTCATDAVPLVQGLGADCVLDYTDPEYNQNVAAQGKYEIILDCAQVGYEALPKNWQYSTYISLNSPLLKNTDQYGLLGGLVYSAANIIPTNMTTVPQGKCVKWAYFYPSIDGLKMIDKLIKCGQMCPVIDTTFKFDDMPAAYEKTCAGHLRGKVMIEM